MCVCVYILLVCKLDIRGDSRIDVVYYIVYAEICWGEYVPGPLVNDSEAARVVCVVPHFTSSHPTPSTKVPHRHFPPTHRTLYSYHPLRMQYPSMHPYHPMSLTLAPSTPHTSQLSLPLLSLANREFSLLNCSICAVSSQPEAHEVEHIPSEQCRISIHSCYGTNALSIHHHENKASSKRVRYLASR